MKNIFLPLIILVVVCAVLTSCTFGKKQIETEPDTAETISDTAIEAETVPESNAVSEDDEGETEALSSYIGKTVSQVTDEFGESYTIEQFNRYTLLEGPMILFKGTQKYGDIGFVFDRGFFGDEEGITGREFIIGVFYSGEGSAVIDKELKTDIRFEDLEKNYPGYSEAPSAHRDYMHITEFNGNDVVFIFETFLEPDSTAYECLVFPHVERTY